jgi:hypothetical protein
MRSNHKTIFIAVLLSLSTNQFSMKPYRTFLLAAIALGSSTHLLRAQSRTEIGAYSMVQRYRGNSSSTTGPWSPGVHLQGVHSSGAWRYGLLVGSSELAYSETTYRWSQLGVLGGVKKSFGPLHLRMDVAGQIRLAPLQSRGATPSGWTSSPIRPWDVALRPSVALVIGGSESTALEMVCGFEQGLLSVDPSDAAVGLEQRVQGVFLGLNVQL